jgi:hypothetical protein
LPPRSKVRACAIRWLEDWQKSSRSHLGQVQASRAFRVRPRDCWSAGFHAWKVVFGTQVMLLDEPPSAIRA